MEKDDCMMVSVSGELFSNLLHVYVGTKNHAVA